jgi:hypothetical protein
MSNLKPLFNCIRKYPVFILCSLFTACSGTTEDGIEESYFIEGQTSEGFEDGTYCADVTYYNPNTGTENTYTLEVEIEFNQVIQINWNNGGWMDTDHFSPVDLDSDGTCSFSNDQGYDYTVQITGKDCGATDAYNYQNDFQEDQVASTCPSCGVEKDEYEEYCYDCQMDIEDSYYHE